MSYTVTCYCNDETIKTTSVYIASAGITRTGTYGSSSLGDYEEFSVSGLTESWSAKFTATPASGCSFYRWVYRVGSTSATAQYSYSNPFTYTGGKDIYIRAEGTQDVETWDLSTGAFGAISSTAYDDFYLSEMQMYRYSVTFNYSGTATIYTEGSVDTYGYFGTSSSFDDYDGVPNSYYTSDDDSNGSGNFLITYNVTAGTTYYVWIRSYGGDDTGYVDLYIEPPARSWSLSSSSLGTISANKTASISISSYTLYRRTVTFSKSGTAKFYTTGTSTDTYGYLSTSTSWNDTTGRPTDYLKSDDDSNGDGNFLISYNVTAGTTYYVWVRGYSETTTGSTTLNIEPPTDSWTLVTGAFGTLSSDSSLSFSLGAMQIRRYSVTFTESGTATFYTTGSLDTYGYLSTSTGFDSANGKPTSILAENDDGSSSNFSISYNVTAGTTYYVWVRAYSSTGSGSTALCVDVPETATRPSNFSWTYSKVKGGAFNLTAAEWNALAKRINEFRAYKKLSNYSFNTAYSGNNYMAYMYNQARLAIQGISGYGTYIPTVSSGDTITAAMMNVLVSELNAIP